MNFFVNNVRDDGISYVHIHIHPKSIIVRINCNNNIYEHLEYDKVIDELREYFEEKQLENIKKYIIDNLQHIGVNVVFKPRKVKPKPKENDNQLSLF